MISNDDVVVLPGDDLQKVYIVYKGSMEIYLQYTPVESVKESKELTYHSEYGILLATLQAGQAFGDRGIFEMHQLPVQYCLVCSEMSELLELSYADYHDICKTHAFRHQVVGIVHSRRNADRKI